MEHPVWITAAAKNTCESCGRTTMGHEVLFSDGGRFLVCTGCVPELKQWSSSDRS